uniref:DNA-directed DNA polymerase n=1 Tax=Tanacetum cinerariifolium TaxID=118510 RepID=A0A6L2L2V2_TANCI|nr:DNA-directed DNA polymerase [Tanacetum cinerariifolium]
MADRTMEELLQAPTEGYGEAIVIPKILAENFEIKTNLLQLVQANKFHGFESENPHTHISNFKRMTATLKYRDVLNDAIKLMLFPYSLEDAARIWYEKEPPNSILTWDDLVNKFVNQFFPPSKTTHLKNKISCFTQRFEETFGEAWDRFKEMLRACPHHGFSKLTQIDTFYNGLNEQYQDSLNAAASGNLLNKTTREALKTNQKIDKLADQISNLVEIVNKQVINPASAKAVEKTCVTCGGAHAYYDCIVTDSNQPSVCAATGSYNQVSLPNRASHHILPPGFAPVQNNPNRGNNFQNNQVYRAPMNNAPNFQNHGFQNQPFSVPNNQMQPGIPNELSSYIKSNETLIRGMQNQINVLRGDFNKQEENLRRSLNDDMRRSTAQVQPPVVPISIPEPDVPRTQPKPTIPYPSRLNDQKLHDLLIMPKFASTIKSLLTNKDKLFELAKVPLNENYSAMLLKKLPEKLGDPELSLQELTPIRMTFELKDRSITRPKGVAKDVFVKVAKFHFPTDFVVVDFEADPRVPLILGRSFLRTGHALIDVYGEEITLRVNDESVSFNLNQTMRPIQLLSMDLKLAEETKAKSSIEEPPELELKELPSHLEYAFLEESDKLAVIIAKDLKDVEKEALIKVLKSHKRAIAWKISDIKGIDPRFCTHKILMEEDYKPAVQSQRRVNPKIHDVIKKEFIKLLDAGMIYPISDSPNKRNFVERCTPKIMRNLTFDDQDE